MDQYQQQKEPPATLPKPNMTGSGSNAAGRSATIMKLRVNFPETDEGPGTMYTSSDNQLAGLTNGTSGLGGGVGGGSEARRGSLLLEGVMKAMRGPATYEAAEEDDSYPDGVPPASWYLENEQRRDSIEHTRSKLANKTTGGGGKGKLQRDRKKLRDHKLRRDSAYNETKQSDDVDYEEEVEQQTKKNTEYNEYLHPLMRSVANAEKLLAEHYPELLRPSSQTSAIPYTGPLPSNSSQYSYSTGTVSDETSDSSLDPNPTSRPAASSSTASAHAVLDELDKELTALVEGLGDLQF